MFVRVYDEEQIATSGKESSGLLGAVLGAVSSGAAILTGVQALVDNFKSKKKEGYTVGQAAAAALAGATGKTVPEVQAQANFNGYDSTTFFSSLGGALDDGAHTAAQVNTALEEAERNSKSSSLPILLAAAGAMLFLPFLLPRGRRAAGRAFKRFRSFNPRSRRPSFKSFRRGRRRR